MKNAVDNFMSNVNTSDNHQISDILLYICHRLASANATALPPECYPSPTTVESVVVVQVNTEEVVLRDGTLGVSRACQIILASLFVVLLVVALLGNSLVVLTVACTKASWTNVHVSILSLAVSDILVSSTCIPLSIDMVLNEEWTLGSLGCKTMPFFLQLAMSANMLTLCCLASDRFLAIVYPLRFCSLRTVQTAQKLILISWIVSLASAIPCATYYELKPVYGSRVGNTVVNRVDNTVGNTIDNIGDINGQSHQNVTRSLCMIRRRDHLIMSKTDFRWISFGVLFLSPTLVMGFAYGIVIHTLWLKTTIGTGMLSATALRNQYKRKAVKMLICVVCLFVICWAPLQIWVLVAEEEHVDATSDTQTISMFLKCLALSSTAYNPIIYVFMNQKFRTTFKSILLRHRARVSPQFVVNGDHPRYLRRGLRTGKGESPLSNNNTYPDKLCPTPKTDSTKDTGLTKGVV